MSIFSHNVYDNVRTRAIVVCERHLLLLEPFEPGAGWQPPGGGLEINESLAECAAREVMEETGLQVSVAGVAFLREWVVPKYCVVPDGDDRIGYGLEVFLYATPVTNSGLPPLEQRIEQRPFWIPLEDVSALPLWPKELKALVAQLLSGQQPVGVPSFISTLESPLAPAPHILFR